MSQGLYKGLLRSALFGADSEQAHGLAMKALKYSERLPLGSTALGLSYRFKDPRLQQQFWGLTFPNPVGLAAGFDKNAENVCAWQDLGFGFCEIGTVTARAQSGNPRPRLFRLPEDLALINRLGFNNIGAEAMAEHLKNVLKKRSRLKIPLGINIGKSKATSLAETTDDYLFSFEKLFSFADYFTINVSSPNTPGLRALQNKSELEGLLSKILAKNKVLSTKAECAPRPILVKLAPDMHDDMLVDLLKLLMELQMSGVILTNTTTSREQLKNPLAVQQGGLSGAPLRQRSTEMIRVAKAKVKDQLTIVGCGGIFSAEDAWEKLQAGASLIQIYTGFIYEGPSLPSRINKGLLKLGFSERKSL